MSSVSAGALAFAMNIERLGVIGTRGKSPVEWLTCTASGWRRQAAHQDRGPPYLEAVGFGNTEVAADFAHEVIVDLSMPRHCAATFGRSMAPPRMTSTFA